MMIKLHLLLFAIACSASFTPWNLDFDVVTELYGQFINVGTPSQSPFTGLTMLTADSTICLPGYNNATSSTYTTTGETLTVDYKGFRLPATGSSSTDRVVLNSGEYVILNQNFVYCNSTTQSLLAFGRPGAGNFAAPLGIAPRCFSTYPGSLEQKVGIWLGIPGIEDDPGAEVTIGFNNSARYLQPLTQRPLFAAHQQLWTVEGRDVQFGFASYGWNPNWNLDMSFPYILVPLKVAQVMAVRLNWTPSAIVNGMQTYQLPNANANTLTSIFFGIGPADNFVVFGPCYADMLQPQNARRSLIVGSDSLIGRNPVWILGQPFMQCVYTLLDYATPSIYLAQATREGP